MSIEDEDEWLVTVEEAMDQIEAKRRADRRERARLGMPPEVSKRFEDDGTIDEVIACKLAEQDRQRRAEFEELKRDAAERLQRHEEQYRVRREDQKRLSRRKPKSQRANRVYRCSICKSDQHTARRCTNNPRSSFYRQRHTPILDRSSYDRLKSRVDAKLTRIDGGHVVWTGGQLVMVAGKQTTARRVVWALLNGHWPQGRVVQGCSVMGCLSHAEVICRTSHVCPIVEGWGTDGNEDAPRAAQDAVSGPESPPAGTPLPGSGPGASWGHSRPIAANVVNRLKFRLEQRSVELDGHCLWQRGTTPEGVPITQHDRRKVSVYVLAWALRNGGEWPKGEVVNTCGIPTCFAHLEEKQPRKRPSARRRP